MTDNESTNELKLTSGKPEVEDLSESLSALKSDVGKIQDNLRNYAANLAINAARTTIKQGDMAQVIADLIERVDELEAAEANADNRVAKLTEKEGRIDEAAWSVFDNHQRLKEAGGFYDLDCLSKDISGCEGLVMDNAVATALRWCANRSRWFTNVKYWVRPIETAGTLVIQRNRFVFQIKTPPEEAMFLDT